jgi:hypothetical protein
VIDSFVADISNMGGEKFSRLPWRIGDGQRCNLADARTTINGQHQAKMVARGLEDAEHSRMWQLHRVTVVPHPLHESKQLK